MVLCASLWLDCRKCLSSVICSGCAAGFARAATAGLNARLIESERRLTSPEGLPNRPWFVHQIYAPGYYTGYGVKTLPGVREAIEQKDWKLAEEQIGRLGVVLTAEATLIGSAADQLLAAGR